jgi:hypothetical protein
MAGVAPDAYVSIPKDFPRANLIDDVLLNYQLCMDLVRHIVDEVRKEQVRHPLVPASEMVEMHLDIARRFGWGCVPGEIEWIFRTVVRELGCEHP